MAVHELAHVVMMLACGGQVRRLTLRFADLQIAASGLGYRQELLSALAGPLVNLICGAAFCMQRPSFAAYSLMLGIYNLLPVWPLDGGRGGGMVYIDLLNRARKYVHIICRSHRRSIFRRSSASQPARFCC